jgi:hypothetical protein
MCRQCGKVQKTQQIGVNPEPRGDEHVGLPERSGCPSETKMRPARLE